MHKIISLAAAALFLAPPAFAHIVLAEPEATAGSYYAGFFRVGHGCGPSPTLSIRITIPEGILTARPQAKPGWTVSIDRETLAEPIPSEYGAIAERVVAVTWTGELLADQFDQFGLLMKLPAHTGPLYFAVLQTCAEGARSWTDIPAEGQAWHDMPNPAPVLMLTVPDDRAGDHHDHGGAMGQ